LNTCERCGKPRHTGQRYCSRKCSALARSDRLKTLSIIPDRDIIPGGIASYIASKFGAEAPLVLRDMQDIIKLAAPPAPPTEGGTEGGYPPEQTVFSSHLGLGDYRPDDDLSFDTIELMLQNAQVVFVTTLKKAPIRTVFRNTNSWRVIGKDEDLAKRTQANMAHIFPTIIDEVLTSLEYGSAFGEMRWRNMRLDELELEGDDLFTGLHAIDFCWPGSIVKINRTSDGKFDGFQQRRRADFYDVSGEQALIVPYDGKFRNLWGRSYYRPMYVTWYWYEVVWRCFLRYLERQATPVVVVKAPQRGTVKTKSGVIVEAMDHAIVVGADIAKSNVAAIPSDRDDQSNQPLWELDYLVSESRTEVFIRSLQELGTQILRAGLLADRVATQETSVGSYNIASVHYIMTRLDDERILDNIVRHFDEFVLPKFTLYNAGPQGPAMHLATEGLDTEEKTRLFQLLLKLADAKHPHMERVDVKRTLEIENVPMMDDDEWEAFKKEKEEEAQKAMKAQQELMAAKQPGTPFPQKGSGQPSIKKERQEPSTKVGPGGSREQALAELDGFQAALARGDIFPLYVTQDDLDQIRDQVGIVNVG